MIKQGDRVKLIGKNSIGNISIPTEHICTATIVSDGVFILRYGYHEDKDLVAGATADIVIPIDIKEFKDVVDYKQLVSVNYHAGKVYIVEHDFANFAKKGELLTISRVDVQQNEKDDTIYFMNNKEETIGLNINNIEALLAPYVPEFHDKLGKEIDFTTAQKNYYLVGSKMIDTTNNKIVYIKVSNEKDCEVEDADGFADILSKEELQPIANYQELLNSNLEFNHVFYKPGTAYVAKENIKSNLVLSKNIKPSDVIRIAHSQSKNINFYEDTFLVEAPFGVDLELSVFELEFHFDRIKGMYKRTTSKEYVSSVDVVEEGLKIMKQEQDQIDLKVQLNSISVGEYQFEFNDNSIRFGETIDIDDAEKFIKALTEAVRFKKERS